VEPELAIGQPPEYLYHGTTEESWQKIRECGHISKMGRHAVHMQAVEAKAWQSAKRWHRTPVVLKINAAAMDADGFVFGVSDNGVWCTESVPAGYIIAVLPEEKE
jgi:putative RNA 2'-phosphotransferase